LSSAQALENQPHSALDPAAHGEMLGYGAGNVLHQYPQQTVTNIEGKQAMIRKRLGLKALGLSAMLLGLMAFSASGAQAANWMVGANNVTVTLLPSLEVKEIEKLNDAKDPGKHSGALNRNR
jgi:hypothetical protein